MARRVREPLFQSRHWQALKPVKDSWWARPACQVSREAFEAAAAERDEARNRDRRTILGFREGKLR